VPGATLDATLTETPQGASDSSAFPSATTTIPFGLNTAPNAKPVMASTGRMTRLINSPSAFVTLEGVGTNDTVQQASTLYARVRSGGFQFRVTFANPPVPLSPIVSILPQAGVLLLEPDAASGFYVTKFEVQGSGTLEWYASGVQ
jgi:hypothetical protein